MGEMGREGRSALGRKAFLLAVSPGPSPRSLSCAGGGGGGGVGGDACVPAFRSPATPGGGELGAMSGFTGAR